MRFCQLCSLQVRKAHTVLGPGQHHKLKQTHVKVLPSSDTTHDANLIRNIGIMAHIDAGKTTTTERLLYLAGVTSIMGDVDDGSTVTDFMALERERGITIQSAAITFDWKDLRINLIDTPGHVDFTIEVERCLRVLDGALTVLDASAGVEAQTLTVFRQAKKFKIPSVIFLNKMDKPAANHDLCLQSIQDKLHVHPLSLQYPIYKTVSEKRIFVGIIDLLSRQILEWPLSPPGRGPPDGKVFDIRPLREGYPLFDEAMLAREKLFGVLSEVDEAFAKIIMEKTTLDDIHLDDAVPAIRRATLNLHAAPVICGSAHKMRAIQPVLQAIASFLPSPVDRWHAFLPYYKGELCALAFKVAEGNSHLGNVTYVRTYSGNLHAGDTVFNANRTKNEVVTKVYIPHSDQLQEVSFIESGSIGVVAGLKETVTGDTLVASFKAANEASKAYAADYAQPKPDDELDLEISGHASKLLLAGIEAPDPVYFCSVEAPSITTQKKLVDALNQLQKEDPSLRVKIDSDSNQMILQGMGDLHIEIIKDRLLRDYKLDVFIGNLQINYKEAVESECQSTVTLTESYPEKQIVSMTLKICPAPGTGPLSTISIDKSKNADPNLRFIGRHKLAAILEGCKNSLLAGPLMAFPVQDVAITVIDFQASRTSGLALVSACASQCTAEALVEGSTVLLEPFMALNIVVTSSKYADVVLNDLSQRRAEILDVIEEMISENGNGNCVEINKTVHALAPLAELEGYCSRVRAITSGTANIHMQIHGYRKLSKDKQNEVVQKLTSF